MTRRARWITRLLGPAVLAYFLATADLRHIAAILRDARWAPILLSLALFAGVVLTKSWRWRYVIGELGMTRPSMADSVTLFLVGQFAGGVTPGQTGDFVRAWYLRERGSPLSAALFSILLDRLLDFLVLALVALAGLLLFQDMFPRTLQPAILGVTIAFAAGMIVVVPALMSRRSRGWLLGSARRLAPAALDRRLERWQALLETLELRPTVLLVLLAATVAATAVVMVRLWLLFRALGVVVPLALVVSASALISILQTIPVSVAGLGVRDAVLVAALARHGYPAERALALSALMLLLVVEQMLIGFVVSMRHPLGAVAAPARASAADDGGGTS
jgi:uncharacterized protein (TIRG00374 family)